MDDRNKEQKVEKHVEPVPYIAHEADMARMERIVKRLWIALIAAVILLAASNAGWLIAWTSYDYTSSEEVYTYQQDGEGVNVVGNGNEVQNGAKDNGR